MLPRLNEKTGYTDKSGRTISASTVQGMPCASKLSVQWVSVVMEAGGAGDAAIAFSSTPSFLFITISFSGVGWQAENNSIAMSKYIMGLICFMG
jgi:hypothetical protein